MIDRGKLASHYLITMVVIACRWLINDDLHGALRRWRWRGGGIRVAIFCLARREMGHASIKQLSVRNIPLSNRPTLNAGRYRRETGQNM